MAKNFVQRGDYITVAAPTGGVKSGAPVLIGNTFGIAMTDAAEGEDVEIATEGVFDLASAGAINVNAAVYWDVSAAKISATASTNWCVGVALLAVASDGTVCRVRLNGAATFAAA
jgi:predicted RecA/RadA family phage recombinase